MAVLHFTQITDSRFENEIENLLLQRIDEIRERLSKLEGVSVKTNDFREVEFDTNKQYRCDFYISKEGRKTTWNDVYKEVNAVKAVPYSMIKNIDFDDIRDIPYKPLEKQSIPGLNDSVRDWYMVAYPTDDYGSAITVGITFKDMIENEGNTMQFLGRDSVIHERVMSELAQVLDVEQKVQDWYIKAFPDDELGEEINPDISFKDVLDGMNKGEDVYDILAVGDSLVRERVFDQLSDIYNIDYDVIYNKWLKGAAYPELFPGQKIDDEKYIISVLKSIPRGMSCFGQDTRDNLKLGTIACICDGNNLFYLSDRLKDSEDVVKAALYHARFDADKTPLAYASERLRDNIDMVKFAVQNNPANLQFASKRIKDNPALLNGKVQANKSPLDDIIKGATTKANNQPTNDKPDNHNKSR